MQKSCYLHTLNSIGVNYTPLLVLMLGMGIGYSACNSKIIKVLTGFDYKC